MDEINYAVFKVNSDFDKLCEIFEDAPQNPLSRREDDLDEEDVDDNTRFSVSRLAVKELVGAYFEFSQMPNYQPTFQVRVIPLSSKLSQVIAPARNSLDYHIEILLRREQMPYRLGYVGMDHDKFLSEKGNPKLLEGIVEVTYKPSKR